jgi:alkylated DNA repair dioxygenase AlkB
MQLNFFDTSKSHQIRTISNFQNPNPSSALLKIPGLKYVPQFISNEEHNELLQAINKEKWLTDLKRRVQHYGWKYDYKARSIDYSMYLGELPNWAKSIAERLHQLSYISKIPDQLIINEYQPGQGIANHVDCEPCFGETIISVSLGSACVMDFINIKSKEKIEIMLEPRSLVIITGEARHDWSHGIASRKTDEFNGVKKERQVRVSLTFRNVILNTCDTTK